MSEGYASGHVIGEQYPTAREAYKRAQAIIEEMEEDGLGRSRDLPLPGSRIDKDGRFRPMLITSVSDA